jgi:hypothetical protein
MPFNAARSGTACDNGTSDEASAMAVTVRVLAINRHQLNACAFLYLVVTMKKVTHIHGINRASHGVFTRSINMSMNAGERAR